MNNELTQTQIEQRFIAAVIKDSTDERRQECKLLDPEAFADFQNQMTWRNIIAAKTYDDAAVSALKYFGHETAGEKYTEDRSGIWLGWLSARGLGFVEQWKLTIPLVGGNTFAAKLQARQFDFSTQVLEPVPRFLINGKAICTPGNLTNIIAQAKAGKTATIAAAIAAAICAGTGEEHDTLGITASDPGSKILLHFDTEQSIYDHHQLILRALRRAGAQAPPDWLRSYALAGFSAVELRRALVIKMKDAAASGGIFAVIIDGTADLVVDVNDSSECNSFVAELHGLAIEHDCPIINVVHENPGQNAGKMRGHLGSQLERKAESNLRLSKQDQVTVIFSEKMRKAPILESDGPRFQWSDDAAMHVSVNVAPREDTKIVELRELFQGILLPGQRLNWTALMTATTQARTTPNHEPSRATVGRWITQGKSSGVIKVEFGAYSIGV